MIWVILLYLLVVLAVGWRCRRQEKSNEGHFLAGRTMGALPVGLSIMVTSFSAINTMAIPEEVCNHGLYVAASFPVFFLAAWIISRWWMPAFHSLKCISAYQLLEERYDLPCRQLGGTLFLIWRGCWMAIALYVSGKILAAITGISPLWTTLCCGAVATMYTAMGGMKAVMWTDMLQFAVIVSGFAIATGWIWMHLPSPIWETLTAGGRLKPFHPLDSGFFSLDPRVRITLWSALLGTTAAFLTRYGADQVIMQRYFAAKDLTQARRGLWINAVASVVTLTLLTLLGLTLHAWAFSQGTTGGKPGFALRQIIALMGEFPPALSGLVIAGILAATMSSIDSGINACAASILSDFASAKKTVAPRKALSPAMLTLFIGSAVTLTAMAITPWLNHHQSIFAVINKVVNGLGTPLLALIVAARFFPKLPPQGVFYGGIVGTILSLMVTLFVKPLALHYYAVVNLLLTGGAIAAAAAVVTLLRRLKCRRHDQ